MADAKDGDVALIINAGSDAGFRMARDLLGSGYRVAVTDRRATELSRIVHGYSASRVLALAADITDQAQLRRVLRRTRERFGRIDVVLRAGESSAPERPLNIAS